MRGGGYIIFVDSDDFLRTTIIEKCMNAVRDKFVDGIVFGVARQNVKNDEVISCRNEIPSEMYECLDFSDILDGPLRYMYGIPGTALAGHTQQTVIQTYKQFDGVWCWCYSVDFIIRNSLRFHEDIVCGEDEIFTGEFLSHANAITFVPEIGYEYLIRTDGMVKTRAYAPYIIDNKIILLKYRQKIRDYILERVGEDISDWAYGSYVLSIFQLCVSLANEKHGYRQLKRYVSLDEVKRAVKAVPLKGKPKLVLPLFLCKCGCYRLVYIMISLLKKMGISIGL